MGEVCFFERNKKIANILPNYMKKMRRPKYRGLEIKGPLQQIPLKSRRRLEIIVKIYASQKSKRNDYISRER
jgi:hypothetical protein